jgi:hypothetical protein
MPDQKRDGGRVDRRLGPAVNRIGHHKDRADQDDSGDVIEMPLTIAEAELMVQTATRRDPSPRLVRGTDRSSAIESDLGVHVGRHDSWMLAYESSHKNHEPVKRPCW